MERVKTREDVVDIFTARNKVRKLESELLTAVRYNNPLAAAIQRDISNLRKTIRNKYAVIL